MHERGLTCTSDFGLVKGDTDTRQRAGIVQRAMRRSGIDVEASGEIAKLRASRVQVARERQGVERAELGAAHPAKKRKVELITVVRHKDVRSAERLESRPDLLEIRRIRDILLRDLVGASSTGLDRDAGPHECCK